MRLEQYLHIRPPFYDMINGPGRFREHRGLHRSAVKVLVHSLSFFVMILRRLGGGTPDRENIMRVTNWCFYLRLLTLLHYVYFLEFHIADGGSMGDVGRGRGNIIKLASSTGHDIVQVTGHAFTRVRILTFFVTDHGTGRPIGQNQTSLTFL